MTRKETMLAEIRQAKASGVKEIWYGNIENAEPIDIDDALTDIAQMDEDSIGEGNWGVMSSLRFSWWDIDGQRYF